MAKISTYEPPTRHRAPLPREQINEMGFVWDGNGRIIAPWPRHVLWQDEEQLLCRVIDQIAEYGAALRVPVWLFPDGRPPAPVKADDPRWLDRWAADRASYVSRRDR